MAAAYNPCGVPVKNKAFTIQIALKDNATPGSFKANPTLAVGDVKISGSSNGGSPSAMGNITTLPSVDPSGSIWVNVAFTAGEFNFDQVWIQFIDQTATKEWADWALCINTVPGTAANVTNVNVTGINDSSSAASAAALFWAGALADSGTAQTGAASTITLKSGASAVNDFYKNGVVVITSGTGAGQSREITGYVGSTKIATVDSAWATNPDNTSVYVVLGRIV